MVKKNGQQGVPQIEINGQIIRNFQIHYQFCLFLPDQY